MTQYSGKLIRKTPLTPTQQSASGVWKLNEQAAAIRNNAWPVAGVPDPISRSSRFRASASAYYNRTPSVAGNSQKFTWSGWVKRGTLTSGYPVLFMSGNTLNDYTLCLNFDTSDKLTIRSYGGNWITSNGVYRDPSAWYHIIVSVDTTQAVSTDRVKLYVNGSQISGTYGTAIPQNFSFLMNTAVAHTIGYQSTSWGFNYFDGYMTEINFVDGQQLTPSSFGTTDAFTGAWVPMAYTGTYGTNGFYLNFKDNTSTTTLGYDYSGNANNWTANNISLTAGTTYDSMLDVPTPWVGYSTTTDTTAVTRGNYATLNPLDNQATLSNGNLTQTTGAAERGCRSTFAIPDSGLWYAEATVGVTTNAATVSAAFGLATASFSLSASSYNTAGAWDLYSSNFAYINRNGSVSGSLGYTLTAGDVVQIAVDPANGRAWVGRNNTWYDASNGTTGNPSGGTNPTFTSLPAGVFVFVNGYAETWNANFGQRPFSYTPPTGFKSLCATNLPDPTIKLGAQYMAATLYTGNGTTQTVANSNGFAPDLVWLKMRNLSGDNYVWDSVRGGGAALDLITNRTSAEGFNSAYQNFAFASNGFTITQVAPGNEVNYSGYSYIGWQWKANGSAVANTSGTITSQVNANTTAGFSIVTYTGNAVAGATVGHGLGVAPSMIIVKGRNNANHWAVYTKSTGATNVLYLDGTIAATAGAAWWNNTSPTSSVFTVGNGNDVNGSVSNTYVAYCWAEVAGYSKFGSYTGNGSADGPFVYCGFRPRWIMWKRTDSTSDWAIVDTSRDPYNLAYHSLYADLSSAEDTGYNIADYLSNGFKMRGATIGNVSGATYIFAAFAENPFKYSNAR